MGKTNDTAQAAEIVRKLTEQASAFLSHHSENPAAQMTFGYFTRHPVAPLNQKRLLHMLLKTQERARELNRPLRILDLACGGGIITSAMAAFGHRALGMDLSPEEIHLAQLFAQEGNQNGQFWQTDLIHDGFWESTVEQTLGGKPDIIVLAYALHHLPQVEFFVDRLSRWLPEGSRLLINEENPQAPLFQLKHRVRTWIQKDTDVEWHRTYHGWKQLLEDRGFQVAPPTGLDPLPGLGRMLPLRCWSLVFTADRS